MPVDKHNEFVSRVLMTHGKELVDQGSVIEQMIALESITVGLLALIIHHNNAPLDKAYVFTYDLIRGIDERLPKMLGEMK